MAFDGLFTRAMVKELADCLVGGRVVHRVQTWLRLLAEH